MNAEVGEIRDFLNRGREELLSIAPSTVTGQSFHIDHTKLIDEVVSRIYRLSVRRAAASFPDSHVPGETEIAIVATGGYGRRELSPFSDVDIAFIPTAEGHPYVDALVKEAFALLMDVFIENSDLNVGYAYRPVGDCPRLDHETRTSLLDMRLVAGAEYLVESMRRELLRYMDVVSFLQEKTEERHLLYQRQRSGLYALEPNLKEGSGGLRDLHSALWMTQVMFGVTHDEVYHELVRRGIASPRDLKRLADAREQLWTVRNYLHLSAGKKNDVLVSDAHDRIARDFGCAKTDNDDRLPSAQFMDRYYSAAETVYRFSRKVAKRFLEGSLALGSGFVATRQRIGVVSPDLFHEDPATMLVAFELGHRYGFRFDLETEALMDEALPLIDDAVRSAPRAAKSFLNILKPTPATGHTLRRMRDRGVLQAYLPEIGELMHCVPADPAHELTVGEHSLRVIDYLVEIGDADAAKPTPLADAMREVTRPEVLLLAAILHDVGKVRSHGDHAVAGAQIAQEVGQRLGLDSDDLNVLSKLVREHLTLVRLSRLRDLNSPVTLQQAVSAVGDRQTLKMLYVVSYADTKAVGATAYTEVDMRLLDELYAKVNRAFCEETLDTDLETLAAHERVRVRTELTGLDVPEDRIRRLSEWLPASYLVNTPLGLIATHLKLLDSLESEDVVIDFYTGAGDDFTELTICTHDDPQPGMLSKITGVLYAADITIRTAQVYTMGGEAEIVLDTLWVSYNAMPLSEEKARRTTNSLRRVLSGQESVEALILKTGRPLDARVWIEQAEARNDLSNEHTVLHLVAGDVKGLLYFVTRAVAQLGLDIHTAKITTWSGKAEDAFYVTRRDRHRISDQGLSRVEERIKELLSAEPCSQMSLAETV